jgi:hypothetical protein
MVVIAEQLFGQVREIDVQPPTGLPLPRAGRHESKRG